MTTTTTTETHPSDARLARLDRVADLYAGITAATRVFLSALAECDRLGDWSEEGFTSCAEWLSWRLGITRNTANEKVRVAHALERLPKIARAMERGELSFCKVRALTRVATPENEPELLPYALSVSAAGLERFVRSWREIDGEDPAGRERRLHVGTDQPATLDDGAALSDGTSVTAVTARRLICDAGRVDVTHAADGTVLDVGRRTRTVPSSIRRALEARDGGCRFPGCGSRFTDAHHVVHWADGGETSLGNLVLLCRRHHRSVHEGGVTVAIDRHQQIVFFTPDGRAMAACGTMRAGAGREAARGSSGPSRNPARRPMAYRSDALIPWTIEAAAWEALDPPDAA